MTYADDYLGAPSVSYPRCAAGKTVVPWTLGTGIPYWVRYWFDHGLLIRHHTSGEYTPA